MLKGSDGVIPIHFPNELAYNGQIACIRNSSHNDSHLPFQKQSAETSNGLGLAAAGWSFDKGESIPACLSDSLILTHI